MTVLIDLHEYAQEVSAFAALAEAFVDKTASLGIDQLVRSLRAGIASAQTQWTWQTAKPVIFGPSTAYDGPGKKHLDTRFELEFTCAFSRLARLRKKGCTVWELLSASTHIKVVRADVPELAIHFDYKNRGQWGPQLHFQVSEGDGGLPIPRLVSAAFLPTDCADVMLSELHPEEWDKHQRRGKSLANVSVLRNAQEHRTLSYLNDIAVKWRADRSATRFSMLQSYTAGVSALPDHRGVAAVRGW